VFLAIAAAAAIIALTCLAIMACIVAAKENKGSSSGRHSSDNSGLWFWLGWNMGSSNNSSTTYGYGNNRTQVSVTKPASTAHYPLDSGLAITAIVLGGVSLSLLGGLAFGGVLTGLVAQSTIPFIGWASFGALALGLGLIAAGVGLRAIHDRLEAKANAPVAVVQGNTPVPASSRAPSQSPYYEPAPVNGGVYLSGGAKPTARPHDTSANNQTLPTAPPDSAFSDSAPEYEVVRQNPSAYPAVS